jgi:signal peptidase I
MKRRPTVILTLLLMALTGCGGSWSSGDRVLVFKGAYDTGMKRPRRFDVVVFRCPQDPGFPQRPTRPLDNFIKRLLGLAGETLAIFFGQVFMTTDLDFPEDRDPTRVDPLDLWKDGYLHKDDRAAQALFRASAPRPGMPRDLGSAGRKGFEIIRKPPDTLLALRRIVYDNDFPAKDLVNVLPPRWAGAAKGSAWAADTNNGFAADAKGKEVDWLRYQHILRPLDWPGGKDREHKPQLITDFMGYNSYEPSMAGRDTGRNWVGDLLLDFELTVDRAEGAAEVWVELARGIDRFQARWELGSGQCTLWRLQDAKQPEKLRTEGTAVRGPGTYHVRFANCDERLTVWVGRELPFGDGVTYARAWHYDEAKGGFVNTGPGENDLRPASIGVKGASVRAHHVKLWRNTYYTLGSSSGCDAALPQPKASNDADVRDQLGQDAMQARDRAMHWESFWSNPSEESLHKLDFLTMFVQPGHYVCMGDNSPESHDSRAWGAVPERLMLGRALVVYYPFTRAGAIR